MRGRNRPTHHGVFVYLRNNVELSRRQVMIATTQKFSGTAKSKHQLFAIANYLTVSQDPIFMSYDRVGLFVMKLSQSFISHPIS